MTTFEQAFEMFWSMHSMRAWFEQNEGIARIVYAEVWNVAIEEAAAVAKGRSADICVEILELKYENH